MRLFIFIYLFASTILQAQNYRAVYDITITTAIYLPITASKDSVGIPTVSKMRFTLHISPNYMTIYSAHLSTESNQSSLEIINENPVDTFLVDTKQSMLYAKQAKQLEKIKKYALIKPKKSKEKCTILSVLNFPNVKVETCKNIPKPINPFITSFTNNLDGVKSIKSGNVNIQLIEFSLHTETVNHEIFFSKLDFKSITSHFDFLNSVK